MYPDSMAHWPGSHNGDAYSVTQKREGRRGVEIPTTVRNRLRRALGKGAAMQMRVAWQSGLVDIDMPDGEPRLGMTVQQRLLMATARDLRALEDL